MKRVGGIAVGALVVAGLLTLGGCAGSRKAWTPASPAVPAEAEVVGYGTPNALILPPHLEPARFYFVDEHGKTVWIVELDRCDQAVPVMRYEKTKSQAEYALPANGGRYRMYMTKPGSGGRGEEGKRDGAVRQGD